MCRVFFVQHGIGNIRDISSSIAFAGNVDLEIFDAKYILPHSLASFKTQCFLHA
jgi:hypothetical protein